MAMGTKAMRRAVNEANRKAKAERRRLSGVPRLRGRGDYSFRRFGNDVATGLGAAAGGLAGSALGPYGAGVGGVLGGNLGGELASIVGLGDYTVNLNSLTTKGYKVPPGQPVPEFAAPGSNHTRIRHREYVGDVVATGSTAFSVTSYKVNPGNAALFPWLSTIASNYSQYEFSGMVAQFVSTTSDITAGGGLGAVVIGANYDPLQANYASKQIMENAQYSISARPSHSMIYTFECDPSQRPMKLLYVKDLTSSSSANQDDRFYDMCNFQVALAGIPTTITVGTVLGELWLSYDVMLWKPDICPSLSTKGTMLVNSDQLAGSYTVAEPFGAAPLPTPTGTLGFTFGTNKVYIPYSTGRFNVFVAWKGPGVEVLTGNLIVAGTNCTISGYRRSPHLAAGVTTDVTASFVQVTVTGSGAYLTYTPSHANFAPNIAQACTCVFTATPAQTEVLLPAP